MKLFDTIHRLLIKDKLELARNAKIWVTNADNTRTQIDLTELAALNSISATDLAKIDGITNGTGAAGKALVPDSSGSTSIPGLLSQTGATLATTAGAGITGGTGTVCETAVSNIGGIIVTTIVLDLTDLDSSGTGGDIIGLAAGGAAHLGQITAARNGAIFGGTIRCLEVPTGGDPDVDFFAADVATGEFDAAVSGLTGQAQLINTGDWTLEEDTLTALPGANQYLYAVTGATDDNTYTAGKFLITLYGI